MSCPYNKTQQAKHCLNLSSGDGKCPARGCPILKEHVEKQANKSDPRDPRDRGDSVENKCPFLENHNCSYLNNLKNKLS